MEGGFLRETVEGPGSETASVYNRSEVSGEGDIFDVKRKREERIAHETKLLRGEASSQKGSFQIDTRVSGPELVYQTNPYEEKNKNQKVTTSLISPSESNPQTSFITEDEYTGGLRRGCSQCASLSYSQEYYQAFGVFLCNMCKKSETLISKSTAKKRYMLTDNDLSGLGSIKRKNPHRPSWQPMQLLLESQVSQKAFKKHGDQRDIERKARELLHRKLRSRMRRREEEINREKEHEKKLERLKQRIEEHSQQAPASVTVDDDVVEDI